MCGEVVEVGGGIIDNLHNKKIPVLGQYGNPSTPEEWEELFKQMDKVDLAHAAYVRACRARYSELPSKLRLKS